LKLYFVDDAESVYICPVNLICVHIEMNIQQIIDATKYNIPFQLKMQQCNIISVLCGDRRNVFAFWPTGFGKSALYMIPPLLLDEVEYLNSIKYLLVRLWLIEVISGAGQET